MSPQILSKKNVTFLNLMFVLFTQAQVNSKSVKEKDNTEKQELIYVYGSAGLNIETNEIDMTGEVNSDKFLIETGFVYSTSESLPTISDTKITANVEENTFKNTLTDLLPNTIYYIRPYVVNSKGTTYGSISTINTSTKASIDMNLKNRIKTYPNPTTSFISLSGLMETKKYIIYNMTGKELAKGSISYNNKIDVRFLKNGMYLLKLDDFEIVKFIKE